MSPTKLGQLELFTDEEEQYIQQEVARLLWGPKLPNAGEKERQFVKQLRELSRDESLVVELKAAAGRYAEALGECLPAQECIRRGKKWVTLPGCYYSRKAVTAKTNKGLYSAAMDLKREATAKKDPVKKWFAQYIIDGAAQVVSNFKMECLYLLRGADGSVTRLVRLMNTKGEVSKGNEIGGADILPNEMYAGAEKFRQWVQSKGNFTWGCEGAGNVELQLLSWDVTEEAAYREVKLIQYCGWHEIRRDMKDKKIEPGKQTLHGLWFFDECAVTPEGKILMPDEDGIVWFEGEGYALSRKGREMDFIQARPKLRPELALSQVQFDTSDWEQPASDASEQPVASEMYASNPLGAFFREVCRRFYDTAGGMEGWLAVGAMLGYAAAPEIYAKEKNFPGLWVSGQMGSGKSTFVSWLMELQGFSLPMGMGLISRIVTAVGIACQLENYSNLALWLDEYREHQISADKEPMVRDTYNRALAGKWSPDGVQRVIRTMTLVSGESTTSDAATRSRYPHVLISEQKRLANHYEWMQDHSEFFFFFWREILLHRSEFVTEVLASIELWMKDPELKDVPQRGKVTNSVCYAAFTAAAKLFGSHGPEEIADYRRFLARHAAAAAADVAADVNVNIFIQDLIVAYNAGEISEECFRVDQRRLDFRPGFQNQGPWIEHTLWIEPELAHSQLGIYLRKGNHAITLSVKDLRAQLSKQPFWIKPTKDDNYCFVKRFGPRGAQTSHTAWGILVDKHPLGTREVTDEDYEASLLPPGDLNLDIIGPQFKDGDPRKGPLFSIVEGWLKWDDQKRRES
jgi:hypothetical protein